MKLLIALSLLLNVWLVATVIRLENFHYAVQTGMCAEHSGDPIAHQKCLDETETRTHWGWHLGYALGVF